MTSLLAQIPFQALVLLGSALVTMFKSIAFVQEGQRGVKLRFGKAVRYRTGKNAGMPKIVAPGFVFMIPYIDKLQRRHVRQETVRLDYQKIMFKDGMIFQVSAMLLFTVTDVFKAMFEIDGLNDAVETFGLAILREELSSRSHKDLADHEKIGKALLDRISQKGEEWGVKFHITAGYGLATERWRLIVWSRLEGSRPKSSARRRRSGKRIRRKSDPNRLNSKRRSSCIAAAIGSYSNGG